MGEINVYQNPVSEFRSKKKELLLKSQPRRREGIIQANLVTSKVNQDNSQVILILSPVLV